MGPAKIRELRDAMKAARTQFQIPPGPSDDADELTAFASAYRHVLVTIQMLAAPILTPAVRQQLESLAVDPNNIYDVYETMPKLNALLLDVDEALDAVAGTNRLTPTEISRVVKDWIGTDSGYLGYPEPLRFSYPSHDEFWKTTCSIVADTNGFDGTTRECFIDTLGRASTEDQAAVLVALLARFPVNTIRDPERPNLRMPNFETVIKSWIQRLDGAASQPHATLTSAGSEVRAALDDAEKLGNVRGVDRVHTAMHSYLHQRCIDAGIMVDETHPPMARLLKALRAEHPSLINMGRGDDRATTVLQGMGQILDVLNPIRNNHSAAHPRNDELGVPEAELVCNTVRTLLRYLDRRL